MFFRYFKIIKAEKKTKNCKIFIYIYSYINILISLRLTGSINMQGECVFIPEDILYIFVKKKCFFSTLHFANFIILFDKL